MSEEVTLAEFLAAFAGATVEPSAGAQAMLKLSLFDWAVCGLAGAGEQVSRIVRDLAEHEGGTPEASVIGSARALPARAAALVNGTTSHALDYDDTHFAHIGHPSVAVIPAALAMAEAQGARMEDFRRAALLGIEASIRTGQWLGRGHYRAGFHQTATAGAVGATVAAARLAGLPETDAAHALGLVATRASGLKSQFGTMGKPFNAGIAAANGVEAALLAARGFEAALAGLDGPQGFGPTHAGQGDEGVFETLGSEWLFETVSHKFHACCHGLHAMLEALAGLDVPAEEVARVSVAAHPGWERVCNIAAPVTGLEAKFSFRLTAAMALSGISTAALGSFSVETACDPAVVALRDRVSVAFDAGLAETEAKVRVQTQAGSVAEASHDLAAPISLETRTDRLRSKADTLLGPRLAGGLWAASRGDDLRALTALLRGS